MFHVVSGGLNPVDTKPLNRSSKAKFAETSENIGELLRNYNSNHNTENLKAGLNLNKDITAYAEYLSSNKDFKVIHEIKRPDGGKILIYGDKNGNSAGSINYEADGRIRNVALDTKDGKTISLNDNNNDDGVIDDMILMGKMQPAALHQSMPSEQILRNILQTGSGSLVKSEARADGKTAEYYTINNGNTVFVLKDKSGNIISLFEDAGDGKRNFYSDYNKDGLIDASEMSTRQDTEL